MTNIRLQPVKKSVRNKIVFIAALLCFLISTVVHAQVMVTVNIIPPYSPYYADYTNSNKVLITVANLSSKQQKIKLIGTIKGDNGVSITTYTNYVPLRPLVLTVGQQLPLTSADLKSIFDINNLSVIGIDKSKLAQTSMIPEGNYTLCLQAFDYDTGRIPLSQNAPSGCTFFNIAFPEPPVLINPAPSGQVIATTPQSIMFNWINTNVVPMGTQYNIQMAEMPDVATDPNQVLNATSLPLLSQNVSNLGYLYSIRDLQLTPGKRYAWRVISSDPSGRILFKNNGVSAAAYFTYGENTPTKLPPDSVKQLANNLKIINPVCSGNNSTVTIGANLNLDVSWLWGEQQESQQYFGQLDTILSRHYTQMPTAKGMVTLGKYQLTFQKISNNTHSNNAKSTIAYAVNAPLQTISLTSTQAQSLGFVLGESYTVNVTSFDNQGNQLDQNTSCPFLLKGADLQKSPPLNIAGRITYTFDKAVYHGANRANITLQLVKDSVTKITTFSYGGKTFPMMNIDYSKPTVSVTTDDYGNYNAQLNLLPTDTGKEYLLVRINSPYYQQPQSNIEVHIPPLTITAGDNTQQVNFHQDVLKAPDVKTMVYNYKLTVTVKKGFNPGISTTSWNTTYGVSPSDFTGKNFVDTVSMNLLAKLPAGITVVLYRKSKAQDIPSFEGDSSAVNHTIGDNKLGQPNGSGGQMSYGYSKDAQIGKTPAINNNGSASGSLRSTGGRDYGNYLSSNIIVATTKTTVVPVPGNSGNTQTMVVFNNLICNFEDGDEYYIKAQLPSADSLGNDSQHLAAPEQRFSYVPSPYNWMQAHYETAANYNIISQNPPTARVKGTVMYRWPSTPAVLRPYANQSITVKMRVDMPPGGISNGDCQYYPTVTLEPVVDANNKTTGYRNVPDFADGLVVAQGITDNAGKFDIPILDLTQMGNINVIFKQTSNQLQGESCEDLAKDRAAKLKAIQDAGKGGVVIDSHTGSAETLAEEIAELEKQLGGGIGGNPLVTNSGGVDNNGGGGNFLGTGGGNFLQLGGGLGMTLTNNTGPAVQNYVNPAQLLINDLLNQFGGGNIAGGFGGINLGKQAGGINKQTFGGPHNPTDDVAEQVAPADPTGVVSRYFSIDNIQGTAEINPNSTNTIQKFVVQPFQTVDLGTIVTDAPELDAKVKVYVVGSTTNEALAGAKVVVFRSQFAQPNKSPFLGEGSVVHPTKKLLSPNFSGPANYDTNTFTTVTGTNSGQQVLMNGVLVNLPPPVYVSSYQHQTYNFATDNPAVEWVIDTTLSISTVQGTNMGTINLSKLRLYPDMRQISLQITPDPENGGGNFDPVLVSLPVHDEVDETNTGNDLLVSDSQYGAVVDSSAAENNYVKGKYVDNGFTKLDMSGVYVTLSPSRIAGRIMAGNSSLGIANATVTVRIYTTSATYFDKQLITDPSGYFEVTNSQYHGFTWKYGNKFTVGAYASGYGGHKTSSFESAQSITASGNKYYSIITLTPSGTLVGSITGEHKYNNSVDSLISAYIMVDDSTIMPVNNDGTFSVPITSGISHKIHFIPQDVAYFDTVYTVTPIVGTTDMGKVFLQRRKHRMEFRISGIDLVHFPLNTFEIIINNDKNKTVMVGTGGVAYLEFENVSVTNYSVQVLDVAHSGYIPRLFNLKNAESKNYQVYTVPIVKGATLTGTVKMNNAPVKNARVYLDYNMISMGSGTNVSSLEARTDVNGAYAISGIPMDNNTQIDVHATLDTSYTVVGSEKMVTISGGQAQADLILTRFNGPSISNVWGFPLSVEKIVQLSNFTYSVTGIVDLSKNNSSFTWMDPGSKIRISNIVFSGTQNLSGSTMQPQAAVVPLDGLASLKMRYLNRYNVLLTSAAKTSSSGSSNGSTGSANGGSGTGMQSGKKNYGIVNSGTGVNSNLRESDNTNMHMGTTNDILADMINTLPLAIEKSGNAGIVAAKVNIADNTFNFPSSYLNFNNTGLFYLSTPADEAGSPNNTVIPAIYSASKGTYERHSAGALKFGETPGYSLSDANGNALKFSFIGFNTTANPASSFIGASGKMHLDATMSGNLPNCTPGNIDIRIKNLVLDGNAIVPATSTDAITVNLQSWKLLINNWTIDPTKGGLFSTSSVIHTGIVDVPVKTFNLRSDLLVIKDFDLKNISLGNGTLPLTLTDTTNVHLVYDQACGSDHSAHWRFSASATDPKLPVAYLPISGISGKFPQTTLNIDYFQLVSFNNENLVSLSGAQNGIPLYGNPKFLFYPASVVSNIGSFTLGGSAAIKVPRINNLPLNLIFNKNNSGLDMTLGGFNLNFEGQGYVQYTYDGSPVTSTGGVTTLLGKAVEPNKINPIDCAFTFGNHDGGTITLKKNFLLNLDGPGTPTPNNLTLTIDPNQYSGMRVDTPTTNDWGTLKFTGPMHDPKSGDLASKTPQQYSFEVLGDIQASSKGIQMSQVATPLGDIDMSYDFASKELHGALHMNQVQFGSDKFSGDVEMDYGPPGMLLMGAGQLNTGTLLVDGFGTFNIGLLFANTDLNASVISKVTQYSLSVQNACWLNANSSGFKGFFLTGGYDIINEHDGVNLGIVDAYFNAVLGAEVSIGANFKKGANSFMAMVGAHGDIDAGLDAITGTSISGGLSAHLTALASYDPSGFAVYGDAGMNIHYQLCQYVPLIGTKCLSSSTAGSVSFILAKGKTKFKFSLHDDGNTLCDNSTNK